MHSRTKVLQHVRWTMTRAVGQPIHSTHPHLLKDKELTVGVSHAEYVLRRDNLASVLAPNSLAIIPGNGLRYSTGSIFYPFHQTTDLLYLTGLDEPNACLMIETNSKFKKGYETTLFLHPYDKYTERWDGPRAGLEGAVEVFGADKAEEISKFTSSYLTHLIKSLNISNIYTDLPLLQSEQRYFLDGTFINQTSKSATHPSNIDASESLSKLKLEKVLGRYSGFLSPKGDSILI